MAEKTCSSVYISPDVKVKSVLIAIV